MNILASLSFFWKNQRGSVGMVFMLMSPVMVAATGLAIEYGNALSVRTQNQRIADAAAYSGALAFNQQADPSAGLTAATAAAGRIVAINGLSGVQTAVAQIPSPTDSARNAIRVTITQNVPLVFAALYAGKSTQPVPVSAAAELISTAGPNCIIALDSAATPGVTLSGGTNITANACGVATNGNIVVGNCGSFIQTSSATYNGALSLPASCGGAPTIRKANGTALAPIKKSVADPYAANESVTTATGRLPSVQALTSPAAPTVTIGSGGKPIDFGYSVASTQAQATANGCTATWTSGTSTWDYNCPAGSNKIISAISIGGGIKVRFNMTGDATNVLSFNVGFTGQDKVTFGQGTFNIKGNYVGGYGGTAFNGIALNMTGSLDVGNSGTATFSNGTYNIARGIYLNGSTTTTFGSGTYNIGSGTVACGTGNYSICAQTSGGVTFNGPATFNLAAGLRTGGGASVSMGTGSTNNSYVFGASSDGYAFRGDGGAKTILADALSVGNLTRFIGNVNLTGGGSCLIVGAASQHDIKGNLWGSGAVKLGAGNYTITGSFNLGLSGGGNTTCGGSNIGLYADNVTLVIGAAAGSLAASGTCAGTAFCVGAGYSSVVLNAPTSGAYQGFAVIGPTSAGNTATGVFTAGASGTAVTGVFYMPNGALKFDGAATLNNSVGGCLEIVGRSVSVTQGGLVGSSCISSGGAATLSVRLVG